MGERSEEELTVVIPIELWYIFQQGFDKLSLTAACNVESVETLTGI